MISQFKSLIQLMDYFKDEQTCIAYLGQQRWGETPCCHHCGSLKVWKTNRGFRCGEKQCGKKFTVTTGTVFENTKISLRLWFAAIYLATAHKKGISSLQLSRDLNVTQRTAWFLLHRIRLMMTNDAPEMLDGTVEVDETYVGGKERNKHKSKQAKEASGRGIDKSPVIALVQRNGEVRAFATPNVGGSVIYDLITKNIVKGSNLITDGFTAYKFVGLQYNHIAVKHNDDYVTYGEKHTNSVEGFFSHLKRMIIGTYHQVKPKHLNRYCNELVYRFNTRNIGDCARFTETLKMCNNKRLTYGALISNNG